MKNRYIAEEKRRLRAKLEFGGDINKLPFEMSFKNTIVMDL